MPLDSPLRRPGPPLLLRTRAGALHRAGERGFVLPLAISAALVALLGSLSEQSSNRNNVDFAPPVQPVPPGPRSAALLKVSPEEKQTP